MVFIIGVSVIGVVCYKGVRYMGVDYRMSIIWGCLFNGEVSKLYREFTVTSFDLRGFLFENFIGSKSRFSCQTYKV